MKGKKTVGNKEAELKYRYLSFILGGNITHSCIYNKQVDSEIRFLPLVHHLIFTPLKASGQETYYILK